MKWTRAESLVRGLDYYRHTAFEFIPDEGSDAAGKLGSQSTILGGGRYDGLMESLGGAPTPAVGWAAGIERLAMLVGEGKGERLDVAVVAENVERETDAAEMAANFRRAGFATEIFATGSPRKRFDKARKTDCRVLISLDLQDDAHRNNFTAVDRTYDREPDAAEIFAAGTLG